MSEPWKQADRAYQAHHWGCTQCQASGKGYGSMCDEGQRLHDAYEAVQMPEFRAKNGRGIPTPTPAPQIEFGAEIDPPDMHRCNTCRHLTHGEFGARWQCAGYQPKPQKAPT